jgi:hypothetical protein
MAAAHTFDLHLHVVLLEKQAGYPADGGLESIRGVMIQQFDHRPSHCGKLKGFFQTVRQERSDAAQTGARLAGVS